MLVHWSSSYYWADSILKTAGKPTTKIISLPESFSRRIYSVLVVRVLLPFPQPFLTDVMYYTMFPFDTTRVTLIKEDAVHKTIDVYRHHLDVKCYHVYKQARLEKILPGNSLMYRKEVSQHQEGAHRFHKASCIKV